MIICFSRDYGNNVWPREKHANAYFSMLHWTPVNHLSCEKNIFEHEWIMCKITYESPLHVRNWTFEVFTNPMWTIYTIIYSTRDVYAAFL